MSEIKKWPLNVNGVCSIVKENNLLVKHMPSAIN